MVLIAFAVVAVVVGIALVRLTAPQKRAPDWAANASALEVRTDILKRRYANGEMDGEEYLQRLTDLSAAPANARQSGSPAAVSEPERSDGAELGDTLCSGKEREAEASLL